MVGVDGEKWKPNLLNNPGQGTTRYGKMQRHLPDVSKKMLTQTLRRLESDGLLKRTVYAEVPPRVEYDLTPLGRSFLEPVMVMCRWAERHNSELDFVRANRRRAIRKKVDEQRPSNQVV